MGGAQATPRHKLQVATKCRWGLQQLCESCRTCCMFYCSCGRCYIWITDVHAGDSTSIYHWNIIKNINTVAVRQRESRQHDWNESVISGVVLYYIDQLADSELALAVSLSSRKPSDLHDSVEVYNALAGGAARPCRHRSTHYCQL